MSTITIANDEITIRLNINCNSVFVHISLTYRINFIDRVAVGCHVFINMGVIVVLCFITIVLSTNSEIYPDDLSVSCFCGYRRSSFLTPITRHTMVHQMVTTGTHSKPAFASQATGIRNTTSRITRRTSTSTAISIPPAIRKITTPPVPGSN